MFCFDYFRHISQVLFSLFNMVKEIQRLQAQIAELQSAKASAVSVPVGVYNHLSSQFETLTTAYLPPELRKQFLSAGDPINKPESGV